METNDVTIEVLKDIRTEIRDMRGEIRDVRAEVGLVREELSDRIDTLTRRVVESEIRTATAITSLAGTVQEMTTVLRASHDLRPRVERCELEIAELKRRVP